MKRIVKTILLVLLVAAGTVLAVSCKETDPYEDYEAAGYTVNVKYDANGGMFTTNVDIIVDTYKISELPTNANGKKEIMPISPNDPIRGSGNAYQANNAGYFLAGWYRERTPVVNDKGEALDANGELVSVSGKAPAYTYAKRWDFDGSKMEIDPNEDYSSENPITLYAAWIPEFKFEFYSIQTGELLSSYPFDPNYVSEIALPKWSEETGKIDMGRFPTVSEKTYEAVYLDSEGKTAVSDVVLKHTGTYHAENATASDPVMKLYIDYKDGEWYKIYTAEQFIANSSVRGCYEILADLDFTGLNWKTSLAHGSFKGKIIGNGHVFSNISVKQTDTKKQNTGLFGALTAEAVIENVTFENVTLTVSRGTIQADASFALFAGRLDASAKLEEVKFENCKLLIDSDANIRTDSTIGLLYGDGQSDITDYSGFSCEATGSRPEKIVIEIDGNRVTVSRAS